jgi:hypothetical protein
MVDLSFLKKRSGSNLKNWQKKLENLDQNKSAAGGGKDDRFWWPAKTEDGKAEAIIRFLPLSKEDAQVDSEMFPWVKIFYHNFQGPGGKYYNETCLSTIGRPDPVLESINPLWKGTEKEVEIARARKRKTSFISNILVIKDPSNPENEGKVFLYKYGVKIHDKIMAAMFPEEDLSGSNPVDVTHFFEGANFHLKVRSVKGYPNYDQSTFLQSGPLFQDEDCDADVEKIWSQQHSLLQFVDPSALKTYDELKARYEEVISEAPKNISKSVEDVSVQKHATTKPSKPSSEAIGLRTKAEDVLEMKDSGDESLDFLASEDEDLDSTIDALFADD